MNKKPSYISTETAAADIDVAKRTIQEWCKQGKITAYKMGKDWRIATADWETFKKITMSKAA